MDQPNAQVTPDGKFLSYLPHSGFHNQRIALENALVLARLLNRTLLVPHKLHGLFMPTLGNCREPECYNCGTRGFAGFPRPSPSLRARKEEESCDLRVPSMGLDDRL